MVSRAAAALSFAAVALASSPPVPAQSLQRLTVQSFTLTADTTRPQVDAPFHLVVSLRVRERVSQITNLELPMLAAVELLGDERETISTPSQTQYRETITVVAHKPGSIEIAPATLQAVDARDGKAKQWSTNGLRIYVVGNAAPVLREGASDLLQVALAALRVLLVLVGLAVVAFIVVAVVRRRPQPVAVAAPAPQPAPPPPPPAPRTPRDLLVDALTVLRAEPTRGTAVTARGAVWRMLGATDGETLGDVLRQRPYDPAMRDVLIALERSAFTYDADLNGAIDDACSALGRYVETLP